MCAQDFTHRLVELALIGSIKVFSASPALGQDSMDICLELLERSDTP